MLLDKNAWIFLLITVIYCLTVAFVTMLLKELWKLAVRWYRRQFGTG